MKTSRTIMAATALLISGTAFAQTTTTTPPASPTGTVVQRDANQQQRIEQGLQNGSLTTQEAAQLEHKEAHVNQMEQKDLANGPLTAQEQSNLNAAQNRVSGQIKDDRHNDVTGNPDSSSSRDMQQDVQRNLNQQQRIETGVQNGSLNTQETGALERGQVHTDHAEAQAGHNGHINATEQAHVENKENHQGTRIHDKRNNPQ